METRNYQSGASATPPSAPVTPSVGYPINGNPATGTPATQPGAYWFYKIGEELRNVIVNSGLTPDDLNLAQLLTALKGGGLFDTQAAGDKSRKVATTEFVKNSIPDLSNYAPLSRIGSRARYAQYNTSVALTAADVGEFILAGGAGSTFTLPSISTVADGSVIVICSQGGSSTVVPQGSDSLYAGAALASSISIFGSQYAEFSCAKSAGAWVQTGGSALSGALGVNQTQQDVTASRALSTTYTNSSRPILIKVSVALTTGNVMGLYVDGVLLSEVSGNATNQIYQTLVDVVPPGKTYQIAPVVGSGTLLKWSELK